LRTGREALVYASGSAFRTDASKPGYWVFTPMQVGDAVIGGGGRPFALIASPVG
jgi:hypothetical protein